MQNNFDNVSQFQTQSTSVATHKVLSQTYALLGVSLFPTVIGALMGMAMNWGWAAGLGIMFPILMILTFLMGLLLGPILQMAFSFSNGGQIVSLAAGGTGTIFLVLASIGANAKRDFSFMGKFLMIGLIMIILAALANWIFQVPAASLAISAIAVMIFSGFILYDVNRIVRGGETNYIMATLALYLNIYNLFVNLLHLLMAFMGNRD